MKPISRDRAASTLTYNVITEAKSIRNMTNRVFSFILYHSLFLSHDAFTYGYDVRLKTNINNESGNTLPLLRGLHLAISSSRSFILWIIQQITQYTGLN